MDKKEKGGGGGGGFQNPGAPGGSPTFPQNFDVILFNGFEGLNTKPTRPAIEDQECYILDGWMPLGKSNARTMYDVGPPIFQLSSNTSQAITFFDFVNISNNPKAIAVLSDGSIAAIDLLTLAASSVAVAGTITYPSQQVGISQWGSQYGLIAAPQTNGYFIWDGTVFYKSGGLGPTDNLTYGGTSYTSAPTITVYGGSGTGAVVTATVKDGSVSQLTVVNPGTGYSPYDVTGLFFSGGNANNASTAYATAVVATSGVISSITGIAGGQGYSPATTTVEILGGTGFGATAIANVGTSGGPVTSLTVTNGGLGYQQAYPPTVLIKDPNNPVAQGTMSLMPFGVQGTGLEVFTSRVWIVNGAAQSTPPSLSLVQFTAPSDPSDFTTTDGAGAFQSTDSFLRVGFHGVRQSNGFLYLIGDSSVNTISGVQTTGSPPITTFTNLNVDPQVGCPWPNTIQVFGRAIVFANSYGIHAMYGGAVQKVSANLDGIFSSVPPVGTVPTVNGLVPSAAVAVVFGIHIYVLLMPIVDQVTGTIKNKMICWDGQKFWTASQSPSINVIRSNEINSVMTAYGTDGRSIYPLFQSPSQNITKTIQSKLWENPLFILDKHPQIFWCLVSQNIAQNSLVSFTIDTDISTQKYQSSSLFSGTWYNSSNQIVTWRTITGATASWGISGLLRVSERIDNGGSIVGTTFSTNSSDMTLVSIVITDQQYRLTT